MSLSRCSISRRHDDMIERVARKLFDVDNNRVNISWDYVDRNAYRGMARAVIDAMRSHGVHTLDPLPLFVDGGDRMRIEKDSYPLFQDSSHLTTQGAQLLRPLFDELFRLP